MRQEHIIMGAGQNDLPSWDLSDFYSGPDATEIEHDLTQSYEAAVLFEKTYQGRVSELEAAEFARAISEYENLVQDMHKVGSYAQLLYAADVSNPETAKFYQGVHERVTDISAHTLFFTLEINRLDDSAFSTLVADNSVEFYGSWLRDVRAFRDHELADDMEQLLHQKSVTGRSSWSRLFDETLADMRIDLDGDKLT